MLGPKVIRLSTYPERPYDQYRGYYECLRLSSPNPYASILLACKQSRQEALRLLKPNFGKATKGPVYCDLSKDTVVIDGDGEEVDTVVRVLAGCIKETKDLEEVRFLAIACPWILALSLRTHGLLHLEKLKSLRCIALARPFISHMQVIAGLPGNIYMTCKTDDQLTTFHRQWRCVSSLADAVKFEEDGTRLPRFAVLPESELRRAMYDENAQNWD